VCVCVRVCVRARARARARAMYICISRDYENCNTRWIFAVRRPWRLHCCRLQ